MGRAFLWADAVAEQEITGQGITAEEIIEIQAMGMPERKRLGEAVEAAFLAKATMLGFPVLKPWGDSRPYDFAVESGRRLWKVQVKCATSYRGTRCNAKAAGSSGTLYTMDDLDFLAAYVIKKNLWYVVPADHKWFTRLVVAQVVVDVLKKMDLEYPKLSGAQKKELAEARQEIAKE